MTCNDLRPAGDDDLMHISPNQHFPVPVSRRRRVVVAPVAHQRQRGNLRGHLLAGVVRCRQWCLESGKVTLQAFTDRPVLAAQTV